MKICPNCGAGSRNFELICRHCGKELDEEIVPKKPEGTNDFIHNHLILIGFVFLIIIVMIGAIIGYSFIRTSPVNNPNNTSIIQTVSPGDSITYQITVNNRSAGNMSQEFNPINSTDVSVNTVSNCFLIPSTNDYLSYYQENGKLIIPDLWGVGQVPQPL